MFGKKGVLKVKAAMGVIVFTYPVNLRYKSVICSKASAFYALCSLLTIIPPLLVAYRSEGKSHNFKIFGRLTKPKIAVNNNGYKDLAPRLKSAKVTKNSSK